MTAPRRTWLPLLAVLCLLAAGCASDLDAPSDQAPAPTDTLTLESKADSVAFQLLDAHGADALASAPYLRFNFAVETPAGTTVVGRHLWDRSTGTYRVEWSGGTDSTYVALIDVRDVTQGDPTGSVSLNGTELTGQAARNARRQAYGRFINDTYWLLAPLKVFDPGVNRTYRPDSSTAEHDVLHLTFNDVGQTPGDEYWLYVSTETGRLDRWAFHLQSMAEETPPRVFEWTADTTLQAPDGPVRLATRKQVVGGERAILTYDIALPSSPPVGAFSDLNPMLPSVAAAGQ
jgi:hypothetical protein